MWAHVTHFLNFETPLISREPLNLETCSLAQKGMVVGTNENNATLS